MPNWPRRLAEAHADDNRFNLIEIMIPRGEISTTLQRFVNAIKQKSALGKG